MAERLGPYTLDKRIGAGGMADVFLAEGPGGVCVVKRPHPHLCANPEFVRMFLDEASLLARLTHPGIARIDDLGQVGGVYYLAMEYVPGFDLMTISLEHERHGELLAPELCARIVADVAGALHYAHEALDASGQPLHLIHRDVSPHNILLSTTGEVKLIDFGVARASVTRHRTQAGFVKGKYPYMAPEQITGQAIDRRVDVYALGLVLYELLTNVRAIAGQTEVEQIENARWGRVRPIEQLRPNTPMPLRQIVASCLLVDPEGRYPTAQALQQDLEKYLQYERKVAGREDLLRLFRVVAAEAQAEAPAGDVWLPATPTDLDTPRSVPEAALTAEDVELGFAPTAPSMRTPSAPRRAAPGPIPLALPVEVPPPSPRRSSPLPLLAVTAVVAVLGLAAAGFLVLRPAPAAPDASPAPVEEAPALTRFTFPAEDAGAPEEPDAAVDVGPGPGTATAALATLRITSEPAADVAIDRQGLGRTPVSAALDAGTHQVLLVNKAERFRRLISVRLAPGETRALQVLARKGVLRFELNPYAAISVNGEALGSASFKEVPLWEGSYLVELELADPSLSAPIRKRLTVQVKGDETTLVQQRLLP
jgi:serine/threonine-protein kinase